MESAPVPLVAARWCALLVLALALFGPLPFVAEKGFAYASHGTQIRARATFGDDTIALEHPTRTFRRVASDAPLSWIWAAAGLAGLAAVIAESRDYRKAALARRRASPRASAIRAIPIVLLGAAAIGHGLSYARGNLDPKLGLVLAIASVAVLALGCAAELRETRAGKRGWIMPPDA